MLTEEIVSVLALCLSFVGVLSSFIFSTRKESKEHEKEREINVQNITTIRNDIATINEAFSKIEKQLDKIDEKIDSDHEKLIEHESRIKNLEKCIFKRGA